MSLREMFDVYGNQELIAHWERIEPRSHEEFISRINKDIDYLIGLIEADAKDFHSSLEDEFNREIVRLLSARCYIASHDHDEGGHVDVRIASRCGEYSWLAEAKIYDGPDYIKKGLNQLIERYSRGTPGHHIGGILVYIQKSRCTEFFAKWRRELADSKDEFEELAIEDCKSPSREGLAFYSEFIHPRIGRDGPKYRIRHIGVSAYRIASAQP